MGCLIQGVVICSSHEFGNKFVLEVNEGDFSVAGAIKHSDK